MTMLLMAVFSSVWAEEVTVNASQVTENVVTWTDNKGNTWTVTQTGGATGQNVTSDYAQMGKKGSPATSVKFSTDGIKGTITKIVVDCASYNGLGTINVTVGGNSFGTKDQSIPKWSSNQGGDVTFKGSSSGEILITMKNGSGGRAMYIRSITVTYEETVTPTSSNIYVKSDYRPYIYTWTGDTKHTGEWPGKEVEDSVIQNGIKWYHLEVKASVFNMILHNNIGGSGNQTADIENVSGDVYYVWNSAKDGYNAHDYLNVVFATVETTDLSLMVDETGNGVTTKTPSGLQMTYESSDPNVATVDGEGNVTAVGKGSATITVSWVTQVVERQGYVNGSATYHVAVKKDPALTFSPSRVTADINDEYTPPTLTYAEDYDGTITYTSSNSAITVNPNTGEVTFGNDAVGKTTTITATAPATDNFKESVASYVLTVINRNAMSGNLNNATFGTSYGGAIQPIASFTSVTGTIGGVTVVYAKGTSSNAYINNNQIRMYEGSLLTFTAPDGYYLSSLTFNNELTGCTADLGTISGKTWTAPSEGNVSSVTITKTSTGGRLELSTVTISLTEAASSIARPTITPAEGTFTEAQTVTITNNAEGATVYYTTDGTTPTAQSTAYTEPFVLNQNGTHTIKAIAISDAGKSSVATATITINIHVDAPTISPANGTQITEETEIRITATAGTIYYTTDGTDPVKNGALTSSAKAYSAPFTMTKAGTVKAVAMNSDGVFSDITSAKYTYNGIVTLPYYERFSADLGNFTTISTGELQWDFDFRNSESFIVTYGEARSYAFCKRNKPSAYLGQARLISPIIDLTEEGLTNVVLNFIHAGKGFTDLTNTCKVQIITDKNNVITDNSVLNNPDNWKNINIPESSWFDYSGDTFPRKNSGDIDLSDFIGHKVRICFLYDGTVSSRLGNWNVDQISVRGELVEKVNIAQPSGATGEGYTTYVTKNDIDVAKTYTEKDVKLYKVIEFDANSVVIVQLGTTYSETMIPAETPVIVKGQFGENDLIIATSEDIIPKPKGNLLVSALDGVTATANDRFFVLQYPKSVGAYGFHLLGKGKTLSGRKAYLNGQDEVETLTTETNAKQGVFVFGEEYDVEVETTPTAIETLLRTNALPDGIYDLTGRKVSGQQLPKGIYVVKGKKFVVK